MKGQAEKSNKSGGKSKQVSNGAEEKVERIGQMCAELRKGQACEGWEAEKVPGSQASIIKLRKDQAGYSVHQFLHSKHVWTHLVNTCCFML
jgi:hypothetical protein